MLDLHSILNLKKDSEKNLIKQCYKKMCYKLHPSNKKTGNQNAFIELQESYKKYLTGDSFSNCWAVVENNKKEIECRCGGTYKIDKNQSGRLDCEYCSCFIEIEEFLLLE